MDKALVKRMMELGIEADKILALVMDEPEQQQEQQEQQEQQKQQEQREQQKQQEQQSKNLDAVLASIEKLTGVITAGNIRRDGFENKPESADDVLAKVLLRSYEEDKK